ncbi:MAG: hypothetical protein PUB37_07585 [Firmicutes bacterium]|nr:hypothetical protein [Bacillota bacterium]
MLSISDALANLSNLPLISNIMSGDFFNSTVMNSLWALIWFVVAYAIVFVMIPAKIMNLRLCDGNFLDNALISLIVSQVTIITVVYALSFLKIYNFFTLILALILVVLVYKKISGKISYLEKVRVAIYKLSDLITGQLKLSIIVNRFINNRIKYAAGALKRFFAFYFDKNVIYHVICTVALMILSIRRCYFCITSEAFPTSDIAVHTSWINFLDGGYVFSDGIYPFGMHNIVSAFAKLTFIDVVTVMRFWGPLNAILMCVVMMALLCRIFKSPAAYTVTAIVYCISSFGSGAVIDRVFFSLPQEYGMMFIFPAAYFMVKFIEEQKAIDGVTFAMAASMTVSAHFYNAIFAVPLCFCLVIPYVTKIFKKGVFKNMVLSVILAAALCLAPMGIGRLLGYPWQGSLDWAVSMMNLGSDEQEAAVEEEEETVEAVEEENQEEQKGPSFIEKSLQSFEWTAQSYTDFWGYVVMICSAVSIVVGIFALIIKKVPTAAKVAIGLGLNMFVFNYCILHAGYFNLPSLIAGDRALNYLIYLGAIMFGVPMGLLWKFFEEKVRPIRWVASVAYVLAAAIVVVFMGYTYQSSAYYRMSYSAVVQNYYKIRNTREKNTWTIVSTVDELALTRNKGWHYELWEFVFSLEQYESTKVIQIPTEYVYFVIEKRPLKYNEPAYLGEELEVNAKISYTDAHRLLTEVTVPTGKKSDYYSDYEIRSAIMSKAYYWAIKYMQYFPDQMRVYYEDSDIIIYEVHQNMYALNNFAIDYGYNTTTLEQWLILHPEALGNVSDSDLG